MASAITRFVTLTARTISTKSQFFDFTIQLNGTLVAIDDAARR